MFDFKRLDDLRHMNAWPVHNFQTWENFQEGQVLLIDKPREWTSFDVVNKIRYAIRRGGDPLVAADAQRVPLRVEAHAEEFRHVRHHLNVELEIDIALM